MIINQTSSSCFTFFISIFLILCRNGSTGSGVHDHGGGGLSHIDDNENDVNEKNIIMNKKNDPHRRHRRFFLKDLQNKENLHLTSLLQDDLSFLEDVMSEKEHAEHKTEIMNRILYGDSGKKTVQGSDYYYQSQHRYLQDEEEEEDDEMMSPPTCIAPPSFSSDDDDVMDSNNTTTTRDNSTNSEEGAGLPEFMNFTGILLFEMIGRPMSITANETEIMELLLFVTYQDLSICDQTGIVRHINQVEIIPDIFGLSVSSSGGDGDVVVPDDGDNNETDTTTTRHRYKRRLLWDQDDDNNDNEHHHTILWKTPNEYFEWNRRRYYESRHRYLQQQRQLANTNNTGSGSIRSVTQPFNWLVRLTGTCNGCALQPSLFDDSSNTGLQQRQRRMETRIDSKNNENNKNNKAMVATYNDKKNMIRTPPPPIRGGGGGSDRGVFESPQSRRTLMDNETDTNTTEAEEICNCPGPQIELFQHVLNDTVSYLIDEGLLQSIDIIDDITELIPTSTTTCGHDDEDGGEDDHEIPSLETFSSSLVLTVKACPNQFLQNDYYDEDDDDDDEDLTVLLSPLEVLALTYQKSFNELNLLNGGHTCDPYARRLIDVTAMLEEDPDDLLEETEKDACIGDNVPFLSIRLNLEAECLGCEGILFESEEEENEEEDNEDLGINGTRQLLRKLKHDDYNDGEQNPYSDLFPFCFCPKGTPSRGIRVSELFQRFNTTLDIFQEEGRGGNEFETVEVVEVGIAMIEPPLPGRLTAYYNFENTWDDYPHAGDFQDNLQVIGAGANFSLDVPDNAKGSSFSYSFDQKDLGDSRVATNTFSTDLTSTNQYTIMFWLKANNLDQEQDNTRLATVRFDAENKATPEIGWQIEGFGGDNNPTGPDLRIQNGTINFFAPRAAGSLDDDQWHHIAFVISNNGGPDDGNAYIETYVDGESVGVSQNGALTDTDVLQNKNGRLILGGVNVARRSASGLMDDFALFDGVVDSATMARVASGELSPSDWV